MTTNEKIIAAKQAPLVCMSGVADFGIAVIKSCAILGIKTTPGDEQIQIMHTTVADHYPWCTLEDVPVACTLNVTNQLSPKTEVYGDLSNAVLCAILTAYNQLRGPILIRHRDEQNEGLKRLENKPIEVPEAKWLEMIEEHRKWFKAGKDTWIIMAARMVSWLYDTGRLADDSFDDATWKAMKAKAKGIVMERKQIGERRLAEMSATMRESFDKECLMELRTVVYAQYLCSKN